MIGSIKAKLKNQKNKCTSKNDYFSLAPDDNRPDKEMFTALDYALNDKSIFNIALTGTYGSGKSSILRSYEKRRKKKKFLNISLATIFDCSNNSSHEPDEETLKQIEFSILQQILYKKSGSKLPNSRIKRITNHNFKEIAPLSVYLLLIFAGILYINIPWCSNFINSFITDVIKWIYLTLTALFSFKYFYKVVKCFKNIKISKLSIKNIDISLELKNETSLLNKYLDEILYFFECNQTDLLVIEDIDRCQNTDIFIKLRELSKLLNDYENIKKPVKFIFVIRDDIFKNKDRAKFFDFIIPVIPVITGSNSASMLLKYKDQHVQYFRNINENFIKQVSRYIDDMRVMKNSINEYIIYSKKKKDAVAEKLFAIILYKNLFPESFHKLSSSEGVIYDIFSSRKNIDESITKKFKEKIASLDELEKRCKKEELNSVKELRTLFFSHILEEASKQGGYITNYNQYFDDEEKFNDLLKSKIIAYTSIDNFHRYSGEFTISEDEMSDYYERLETVTNKTEEGIEKINRDRSEYYNKITSVKNLSFDELYKNHETTIDSLIKNKLSKNYNQNEIQFVIFLIRHNYLDEKYLEYINYFIEGVLSHNDRDFLRNISNFSHMAYDHKLDNPVNVMDEILPREWTQKQVLNFSILDTLLEKGPENHLENFIKLIINEEDKGFFWLYQCSNKNLETYLNSLWIAWPDMWEIILSKSLSQVEINTYLFNILKYVDLKKSDKNYNDLRKYINQLNSLDIFNDLENMEKIKEQFKLLEIKIEKLTPMAIFHHNQIFEFMIKNNMYDININMCTNIISYIEEKNYNKGDIDNYYTKIVNFKSEEKGSIKGSLYNYIFKNLSTFIENVLLNDANSFKESEENFINLIGPNKKLAGYKFREKACNKNKTIITDINQIEYEKLWSIFIKNFTIAPNWDNILSYYRYCNNSIDEDLLRFLNNKEMVNKIILTDRPSENRESKIEHFFDSLLNYKEININSFELLFSVKESDIEIDEDTPLSQDKLRSLIKINRIIFSDNSLENLYSYDALFFAQFFKSKIDIYMENYKESMELSYGYIRQLYLLGNFKPDELATMIKNNLALFLEDLDSLYNEIADMLLKINYEESIPENKVLNLLSTNIAVDKKIEFLLLQFDNMEKETIVEALPLIDSDFSLLTDTSKRKIHINNTKANQTICEKLKSKLNITGYDISDKEIIIRKGREI